MTHPISNDLRKRIVRAVEDGISRNAAAEKYDVGISTVIRLMQRWNETGSLEPSKERRSQEFKLAPYEDRVRELIEDRPDITLLEIKEYFAKSGVNVGQSSIYRFLAHLGLSYKKKR